MFNDILISGTFSMTTLQVINSKLFEENSRYWCAQVLHTIRAFVLDEHITGVVTCPSPFIIVDACGNNVKQQKPKYHR